MKKIFKGLVILLALSTSHCYHSKKEELPPLLDLVTEKQKSVLILGDSLSELSGAFGLDQKLGNSFRVHDISRSGWDIPLWMGDQATIQSNKTDIIIVELGTNDGYNYSTSRFPSEFRQLIEFLESIHYWKVVPTLVPRTDIPELSAKIQANNQWIRENYNDYNPVDLEKVFLENGNLPLYPPTDPIHPNPIGYELIGEEYSRYLKSLPY